MLRLRYPGKPVPAGSVMIVGTMSALRDSRKFANAGAFEPGRELDPALMFDDVFKVLPPHLEAQRAELEAELAAARDAGAAT